MPNTSRYNGCYELHLPMDWITTTTGTPNVIVYIALSIVTGLAGIVTYIYFLRKGQFEDSEEIKYQLFREDEEG